MKIKKQSKYRAADVLLNKIFTYRHRHKQESVKYRT